MKTPMQELIERLDKEINPKYPDGYNIVMKIAKNLTEQMLEKEKEVITSAYNKGKDYYFYNNTTMPNAEEYYNKTFNTKEK